MTTLVLWMNGERVGTWDHARHVHTLSYDAAWVKSPAGRALSLSLPFTPGNAPHQGDVVENYFDNLLPDSDRIRARLSSRFRAESTGAFDLLAAIGRDCVGALQLLPEGTKPVGWNKIEGSPMDDEEVEQVIDRMLGGGRPLGQLEDDDFRISIAGAQEKTALLFHRKRWREPHGATPTTHILKLPLGRVGALQMDLADSVENEWLCLKLFAAYGLPTAEAEMHQFGKRKVLAVKRFDRARQDGWIARLPQEDFCQALGLPSSKKYESEGGPGMKDILRILDSSINAATDKRAFVKCQILFWALAATDGHAKNFSLFLERGGAHRLTPFYDILSAYPVMGRGPNKLDPHRAKLAMAVRSKNVHWKLRDILPRHWEAVTKLAGLGEAGPVVAEIVAQTPSAIRAVEQQLPTTFPAAVSDTILGGLRKRVQELES